MSQTNQTNNIAYIYNPANYSEKDLIKNFIVRLNEFNSIFQVIRKDNMLHPPQHFIIQGLRGNGKTTLLQRLYYEVKNDTELNKKLVPVIFNEEEYGIRKLYKLWERIAEDIEDNSPEFEGIYNEMIKHSDKDDYEETAYNILKNHLFEKEKKLVLFFDNFGEILEKFNDKEALRLREILMGETLIRIVGASSMMLESFYDYSKPFFEFFKIIKLNGLTKEEAFEFLKKIAENYEKPDVSKMIEKHPERVETLRVLTEGVPRTMILLFEIFADNDNGNSFKDLEIVLDRVTPLYKHRMDDLSGIQQEMLDIIAKNWDGIEVSTIAEKTRMNSKSISSQLNVLSKNNVISKISTNTKNNIYILKERFFNIWYLMRYGRKKDENRVKWLTRFLEAWFGDELEERAKKHIEALQKGGIYDKHAFFMCEAFCQSEKISMEIEDYLLKQTKNYLAEIKSPYYGNLSASDFELLNQSEKCLDNKDIKQSLELLLKMKRKNNPSLLFSIGSCFFILGKENEAKKHWLMAIEKGDSYAMAILGKFYALKNNYEKAEEYFFMAVKRDNTYAMEKLSYMYFETRKKKKDALELIEKACSKNKNCKEYNHTLALIALWNDRIEEGINAAKEFLSNEEVYEKYPHDITQLLVFMMAKQQYNTVLKIFNENKFDIKDRFKPVYYALMHFMKDKFPNEYLKMGNELKETVEEIIEEVEKYRNW